MHLVGHHLQHHVQQHAEGGLSQVQEHSHFMARADGPGAGARPKEEAQRQWGPQDEGQQQNSSLGRLLLSDSLGLCIDG